MNNSLDFLDSISIINSSDLKGKFQIFDDSTEEAKFLLDLIKADKSHITFIKGGQPGEHNDHMSQLKKLVDNFNSSIKPGEKKIDLKTKVITAKQRETVRKKTEKVENARVLFSLPKELYPEVRLLCGATLSQIEKEVANDPTLTARIKQSKEDWQLSKMFHPIQEGNKSSYQGYTIETKNSQNGLYNAIIDDKGKEIAELVKLNKTEDSLRDTLAIAFRYDASNKENIQKAVKEAIGKEDGFDFSDLKKLSEYLIDNSNNDTTLSSSFEKQDEDSSNFFDDDDKIIYDNTSSIYDSEALVAEFNGPFESNEPIKVMDYDDGTQLLVTKTKKAAQPGLPLQTFINFSEYNEKEQKQEKSAQQDIKTQDTKTISEKELADKLKEFEDKYSAQHNGITIIETTMETHNDDENCNLLLKKSLDDLKTMRSLVDKEIKSYTTKVETDPIYKKYVEDLTKLNKKIDGEIFSLNMHFDTIKKENTNTQQQGDKEHYSSKNELNVKLQNLQNDVTEHENDIRMLLARNDVRHLTYFEEVRMQDLLNQVKNKQSEINEDLKKYSPIAEKDDDYNTYVKCLEKLNKRNDAVDFSIKQYYGADKYDAVLASKLPATERVNLEMREERSKKQPLSQITVKTPPMAAVGYAQISNAESGQLKNCTPIPAYRCQIDLNDIANKIDKMNITKKSDHELYSFAIIDNKNSKNEADKFLVIAKRQGQPAFVNDIEVKYSDTNAFIEFSLDLKELKYKAEKVGVDLKKIPLIIGEESDYTPIIRLNERSKSVSDKSQPSDFYKMNRGSVEVINTFQRIIQSKQNMEISKEPKIKYEHKDLGDAIEDKGRKNISERDFYFTLNPTDLKSLPECDRFGNVRISICERPKDGEYYHLNNLHLNNNGDLVNERGGRVPEYRVVADPKIYKNGQPYDNTRIEITIPKKELLKMPLLKREKDEVIALKVNGMINQVSLNVFKYNSLGQVDKVIDYIRQKTGDKNFVSNYINVLESKTWTNSRCVRVEGKDAANDLKVWKHINDGKLPDKTTYKNSKQQFEYFSDVASDMKEQQAKEINAKLNDKNKNIQSNDQEQDKNDQSKNKGKSL